MNSERLVRGSLLIGGLLSGLIGIGHIFMPTLGYDPSIALAMAPSVRDHFFFLGTYAICGFLLSFSFLSLYFSTRAYDRASLIVCTAFAAFWVARAVLEFQFPVEVTIFFLRSPHEVLSIVILTLGVGYSVAALWGWATAAKDSAAVKSPPP